MKAATDLASAKAIEIAARILDRVDNRSGGSINHDDMIVLAIRRATDSA